VLEAEFKQIKKAVGKDGDLDDLGEKKKEL